MSPKGIERSNGPALSMETARKTVRSDRQERSDVLSDELGEGLLKPALECANASLRIREGLRGENKTVRDEVDAILNGLSDPRPGYGEVPSPTLNRYLKYKEIAKSDGTKVSVYSIKPTVIEDDLESLKVLQRNHPELSADITAVMNSLHEYARRDQRMGTREAYRENQNSYTSQALGHMGKTAAFVACSFAATIMGGIMIINVIRKRSLKELSFAPFFYGGVALLLASKKTRDSVFGAKLSNALAPVDTALNKSGFTDMARTYGMEGKEWRKVVESSMEKNPGRDALLKKIENKTATPADIDAHVAGITTDPGVRTTLRTMVSNGDYERLARIFSGIGEPEAKDMVGDYVEKGAWKFAKK